MSDPQTWGGQDIPYSDEAEVSVIGALLVNPSLYDVVAFLEPDDFFILRHKYIWQAVKRLAERHEPVDYLLLSHELTSMDKLGEVGGTPYLTKLINETPTSLHIGAYGHLVQRAATRRRLMTLADELKAWAVDGDLSVESIFQKVDQSLLDLNQGQIEDEIMPIKDLMLETWEFVEDRQNNPVHITGLPTGFALVDQMLGGLQSALYILGGRPGMGKSAWLNQLAVQVAEYLHARNNVFKPKRPEAVLVFNLEMKGRQLALRMLAGKSEIPVADILSGQTGLHGYGKLVEQLSVLGHLPYLLSKSWKVNPRKIRAILKQLQRHYNIRLIIVDYIQRMKADQKYENRVQEIGSISRGLVEIAGEFDIPVFAAAQLGRQVESRRDKRPNLSDLKESGDIEQDAHAVFFLYRDDYYKGLLQSQFSGVECICEKNREGPTGMIPFTMNRQLSSFIEEEHGTRRP